MQLSMHYHCFYEAVECKILWMFPFIICCSPSRLLLDEFSTTAYIWTNWNVKDFILLYWTQYRYNLISKICVHCRFIAGWFVLVLEVCVVQLHSCCSTFSWLAINSSHNTTRTKPKPEAVQYFLILDPIIPGTSAIDMNHSFAQHLLRVLSKLEQGFYYKILSNICKYSIRKGALRCEVMKRCSFRDTHSSGRRRLHRINNDKHRLCGPQ